MNVGVVLLSRIPGRHRDLRRRQLVDHVRRMWSVGYRWLFNHAGNEMQHDCRKGSRN
jgi:hypothetical protein